MNVYRELRASNGILRSSELQVRGYSRYLLGRLIDRGELMRPCKGWIALPGADPELICAAQRGVILSCMTVVRRLGLWALKRDARIHVAARSPRAHLSPSGLVCHWGAPVRLREPKTLIDPIENVLGYVAGCQPFDEALAIWESALRKRVVSVEALRRLPFRGEARQVLAACTPFSDSGPESYVRRRLSALGLRVVAQAWVLGHRVDFLIDGWLVFQIDGATHTGEQRDADDRFDAQLHLAGYGTIRAGYRPVMEDWPTVQGMIMDTLSRGRPVLPA